MKEKNNKNKGKKPNKTKSIVKEKFDPPLGNCYNMVLVNQSGGIYTGGRVKGQMQV
jgi:hypothetical protein